MIAAMVLASLALGHVKNQPPVSGLTYWEEPPNVQMAKGYHPLLRFSAWEVTRFPVSTTYMFATPDMVQQGQFQFQDGHYFFRAVMANELENADVNRIATVMDPQTAEEFHAAYARSLSNFEGDYDPTMGTLSVTYLVQGHKSTFRLYPTTAGDSELIPSVNDSERGLTGLWQGYDAHQGKLDAYTRYKIGDVDGLGQYTKEAAMSEGARLNVIDLRVDKKFRWHAKVGDWQRSGSQLILIAGREKMVFTISADGNKLLLGGTPAFVRQ